MDSITEKQMEIQRLIDYTSSTTLSVSDAISAYNEMIKIIRQCKNELMGRIALSLPEKSTKEISDE